MEVRVTRQATREWSLPNLPGMDEQESKAAYRAMTEVDFQNALDSTGVEITEAASNDQRIWVQG